MKTLKEKREELLNKDIRFVDKTCKRLVLEIVEKQDKEFIEEILNEMEKIKNKNFEDTGKKIPKRDYERNIGSYSTICYFMRFIQDKLGFDK